MRDDILSAASRALRETTEGGDEPARFTRARVMADLHAGDRERKTRLALLIPLAAILVGSTAWAGASGRLPRVLKAMADLATVHDSEPASAPSLPARPVARRQVVAPPPASASVEASPDRDEAPEPSDGEQAVTQGPGLGPAAREHGAAAVSGEVGISSSANAAPKRRGSAPAQADALYRAAHRAHFEQRDAGTALERWSEYLRVAPRGRFAAEAAYNRALCLVRLGRASEALSALEPFASGRYGGYRQHEAEALGRALRGDPGDAGAAPDVTSR